MPSRRNRREVEINFARAVRKRVDLTRIPRYGVGRGERTPARGAGHLHRISPSWRTTARPRDGLTHGCSPQIRNRGTVGGNLGTASPAGDACRRSTHPSRGIEFASTEGSVWCRSPSS